jgi:hypothetical protein
MHYIRIARWTRYYLPLMMLTIIGAGFAVSWITRAMRRQWLATGAAVVLALLQADTVLRWLKAYKHDVTVIHNKQAAAGRAARKLPKTARLLVCDAGAIPYLSERWTFDIVGLTTPLRFNWFRHGRGSRFELFERLPPARRPTHVAAYGFCLWPGVHGPVSEMFYDMLLAPVVEEGAGTGDRPGIELPASLKLVDSLDAADLQSEHDHGYSCDPPGNVHENILSRFQSVDGSRLISDGGRVVKGVERFFFDARAGRPVTVVARYTVGLKVRLHFEVAGRAFPIKLAPPDQQGWLEVKLKIPGPLVQARNPVSVRTMEQRGAYHVYHYFFLQ